MILTMSKLNRGRFGVAGCCLRRLADCTRPAAGRCTAWDECKLSRRSSSTKRKAPDEGPTIDRDALLERQLSLKRCKRWRDGWCDQLQSHGIERHGTAEETKAIKCCSARAPGKHGYRLCNFTAETCLYADHADTAADGEQMAG